MGQYNSSTDMLAYIASDDKILAQTRDKRVLVFDSEGYICHDDIPDLFH